MLPRLPRIPVLRFSPLVLIPILGLASSLVSQGEAGGDRSAEQSIGQNESGDVDEVEANERRRATLESMGERAPPLFVQVMQDPTRIAPGEEGFVLLLVQAPPDGASELKPGGTAVFQRKQGPLMLGTAKFTPPPKGAKSYKGGLLVRIPVRMDTKAKYGSYAIKGQLRIPGTFVPPVGPDSNPGANTVPVEVLRDQKLPGQSTVPWAGRVTCGAPMPKPLARRKSRRAVRGQGDGARGSVAQLVDQAPEAGAGSTGGAGAGKVEAVAGSDDARQSLGTDNPLGLDQGSGSAIAPEFFLILAGAGLGLLLLFFILRGVLGGRAGKS